MLVLDIYCIFEIEAYLVAHIGERKQYFMMVEKNGASQINRLDIVPIVFSTAWKFLIS